jgi:hypothetical protein
MALHPSTWSLHDSVSVTPAEAADRGGARARTDSSASLVTAPVAASTPAGLFGFTGGRDPAGPTFDPAARGQTRWRRRRRAALAKPPPRAPEPGPAGGRDRPDLASAELGTSPPRQVRERVDSGSGSALVPARPARARRPGGWLSCRRPRPASCIYVCCSFDVSYL